MNASRKKCHAALSDAIAIAMPLLLPDLWQMHVQVGFVMRLDGAHLTADLDDYLPDFQLAFEGSTEATFGPYYHTEKTQQLNAGFGDLKMKIQDLEVR